MISPGPAGRTLKRVDWGLSFEQDSFLDSEVLSFSEASLRRGTSDLYPNLDEYRRALKQIDSTGERKGDGGNDGGKEGENQDSVPFGPLDSPRVRDLLLPYRVRAGD